MSGSASGSRRGWMRPLWYIQEGLKLVARGTTMSAAGSLPRCRFLACVHRDRSLKPCPQAFEISPRLRRASRAKWAHSFRTTPLVCCIYKASRSMCSPNFLSAPSRFTSAMRRPFAFHKSHYICLVSSFIIKSVVITLGRLCCDLGCFTIPSAVAEGWGASGIPPRSRSD